MTDQNLLRANVTSINPLIHNPDASEYLPVAPYATGDSLRDTKAINPIQPASLGSTLNFEITKQAATVERFFLRLRFNPITLVSGTFVRFQDNAQAFIKEIRIQYSGNQIFRYGKEYLFTRQELYLDFEKSTYEDERLYRNQTAARRNQLAAEGFDVWIDLIMPHMDEKQNSLPVICLSQKLQIEIDLHTAEEILQTDGTIADYSLINVAQAQLYVDYTHVLDRIAEELVWMSIQAEGIPYLVSNKTYVQRTEVSAAAGTQFTEVNCIRKGTVKEIVNYFVPVRLEQTRGSNEFFMVNNNPTPLPVLMSPYDLISRIEAEANGNLLIRPIALERFLRVVYMPQYHSLPFRDFLKLYVWSWSRNPEAPNSAYGNIAFANFDNPTIRVFWGPNGSGLDPIDPAVPQRLAYYIIYYIYSYVQLQGGDITEVFI